MIYLTCRFNTFFYYLKLNYIVMMKIIYVTKRPANFVNTSFFCVFLLQLCYIIYEGNHMFIIQHEKEGTHMRFGFITDFLMENSDHKKTLLMEEVGAENLYANNAGYEELLTKISDGDTLVLYQIHDLASDWKDFVTRWHRLYEMGVQFKVIVDDFFSTGEYATDDQEDIMIHIAEAGYEMNNFYLNQKKISGMKKAKANGVKFGRRKVKNPENFEKYYYLWKAKKLPIKEAAAAIGMNTSTFFRHCREYTEQLEMQNKN